jgi:cell wall-associated NlpC family hydrolase
LIRKTTAVLLAAAVAGVMLGASPAHAAPATPLISPAHVMASGQLSLVSTVYTVGRGDTLSEIAGRFCGHPSAYPALATASGITDPDRIYPGQRIALKCTTYPHPAAAVLTVAATRHAASAPPAAPNADRAAQVIAYALAQIGKPYIWATAGPNSFDCSGLVVAAYRSIGIALPHFTGDLLGRGRAVSRADLRPGDLVFPSYGHVMIYIGDGRTVEAPHSGANVRIGSIYTFYAARRIV